MLQGLRLDLEFMVELDLTLAQHQVQAELLEVELGGLHLEPLAADQHGLAGALHVGSGVHHPAGGVAAHIEHGDVAGKSAES